MSKAGRRYHVKIQEEAIDELDKIYYFIFQDSPSRARNFVRTLRRKILSLKEFPRRGTRLKVLEESNKSGEIRFIEYKGYLIFYTIDNQEVIILHVTGPGQNWIGLLA